MSWQEWVVAVLVVLCVLRLIYSVRLFFRRAKSDDNPCANCASGCKLKELMEKRKQECRTKKKSTKKNCCG